MLLLTAYEKCYKKSFRIRIFYSPFQMTFHEAIVDSAK
jgi:hypothetical protein